MKNLKLDASCDEGWAVHIYDRKRRLLCTLEPSHSWVFCLGLGLGMLLTILGMNLNLSTDSQSPEPPTLPPSPAELEQLSRVNDFLFWVD